MHDEPSHPIELIAFIVIIIAFLPICIIWWATESFVNLFRKKQVFCSNCGARCRGKLCNTCLEPQPRLHDGNPWDASINPEQFAGEIARSGRIYDGKPERKGFGFGGLG